MERAMDNSPEGDIKNVIITRWVKGESPQQIAREISQPVDVIYRVLKEWQRVIIEEI